VSDGVPFLHEIFKLNSKLFLNCLDGMTQDQSRWRPSPSTNSAAFIALHMVDARHQMAQMLGLVVNHPFGAMLKEAKSIDDIKQWPSLDEIRAAWKDVTGALHERFKHLSAAELTRPCPVDLPTDDRSLGGGLAFLLQHDSYHLGMLSLLRKQVGLSSMSYH
jgi:uncharacterized damage-inducible protein DinB